MQYKLGSPDPLLPSVESDFIKCLPTDLSWTDDINKIMFVPKDESNAIYQEYLAWLEEGNTPEPADE